MHPAIDLSRGPRAISALRFVLASEVGLLMCGLVNLSILARLTAGEEVDQARIDAIDLATGLASILGIVAMIVTAVLFIRWLLQARRNALAMGAEGMEYSDGWAIWGWFIPIIALFRPYQVVREAWRASDPAPDAPLWVGMAAAPGTMAAWWGCWVVGSVLSQISFRMQLGMNELSDWADYADMERMSAIAG
ncbi:MAG TPA: DUF4328 domain-containing protein, partial [Longimicrobium sp.]|nr:DUF4328 domain-containing protein [Longimicrobium sp.]